jgi:hypothetical protein
MNKLCEHKFPYFPIRAFRRVFVPISSLIFIFCLLLFFVFAVFSLVFKFFAVAVFSANTLLFFRVRSVSTVHRPANTKFNSCSQPFRSLKSLLCS